MLKSVLFKIEIFFCKDVKVFTVILDKFNACLLNKSKTNYWPQTWTVVHFEKVF